MDLESIIRRRLADALARAREQGAGDQHGPRDHQGSHNVAVAVNLGADGRVTAVRNVDGEVTVVTSDGPAEGHAGGAAEEREAGDRDSGDGDAGNGDLRAR